MNPAMPDDRRGGDFLHAIVKAGLSCVPVAGGPVAELFAYLVEPPLEYRRNTWFNELGERVLQLESDGRLAREQLQQHEQFISALLQASASACRNHDEEKIEALRNAVLNTALGSSANDAKAELFLALVDAFTVTHLSVLKALSQCDTNGGTISSPVTGVERIAERAMQVHPELREIQELLATVVEDLCRRGLVFSSQAGTVTYIPRGTTQVTPLGQEFLAFISDPSQVSR